MPRRNRDVIAVLTFIILCFSLSVSQTDSFLMLVSVDRSLFETGDSARYRSVDLDKRLAMLSAQMNVGCRKLKQMSAGGPAFPIAQYVQEPYSSFLKNGEWLDKVYRKYIAVIQELFAANNLDASRAKNEAITKARISQNGYLFMAVRRAFEQAGVDKSVGGRINVSGCTDNGDLVLEILVDPKLRHEETTPTTTKAPLRPSVPAQPTVMPVCTISATPSTTRSPATPPAPFLEAVPAPESLVEERLYAMPQSSFVENPRRQPVPPTFLMPRRVPLEPFEEQPLPVTSSMSPVRHEGLAVPQEGRPSPLLDQSPVIDIDDTSGLQQIDKSKVYGAGITLENLIFWIVAAVFGSLVLMCVYNCCAACFRLQKDGMRKKKKSQVVDIEDAPLKDDSQKDRHESDVSNEYAEHQSAPTGVIEERS
ncbi:hypothetical protein AAVH_23629 [Aphelenchoides avenae]|nr:hypothetical protein AAVH_23629 [Aphelenchus avenae]